MKFGEFIAQKREMRGIQLQQMASHLSITPSYLSDIEKSRRYPLRLNDLNKIRRYLDLSEYEKVLMFELAGKEREEIPEDLKQYIMTNAELKTTLRRARDAGKGAEFWNAVASEIGIFD